jgi:hypothetical protein
MEVNPSEAVNYLLTELRRVGYSFNSGVTLSVGSFYPNASTHNYEPDRIIESDLKPNTTGLSGSLFTAVAKDPTIQHLISVGLEEF